MNTGSSLRRILAYFIDEFLALFFYLPLVVKGVIVYFYSEDKIIGWAWIFLPVIIRLIYETLSVKSLGALPGQYLMGLRVVDANDVQKGPTTLQCFIRTLSERLRFFVGNAFYLVGLLNLERQHIGDLISETRVVQSAIREKEPKAYKAIGWILVILFALWGFSSALSQVKGIRPTIHGVDLERLIGDFEVNFDVQFSDQ